MFNDELDEDFYIEDGPGENELEEESEEEDTLEELQFDECGRLRPRRREQEEEEDDSGYEDW